MNLHSSRSHAILTVTIESMDSGPDEKQRIRVGHLHLVDLAGSERQVGQLQLPPSLCLNILLDKDGRIGNTVEGGYKN